MLVLQRRFSNIVLQDTNVSPTIEAGGGEGGNNLPIILQSNQNNAQVYEDEETCPTLVASMGCGGEYVPMIVDTLVFDNAQITSKLNYSHPTWGGQCHPLTSAAGQAIVVIKHEPNNIQSNKPECRLQQG